MLDKLGLNKLLIIVLLSLSLGACRMSTKKVKMYDTQIFCPNGFSVFIRTHDLDGVILAVQRHDFDKRDQGTSEKYTVIRLRDKSSLKIDKISPEEMVDCYVKEADPRIIDPVFIPRQGIPMPKK